MKVRVLEAIVNLLPASVHAICVGLDVQMVETVSQGHNQKLDPAPEHWLIVRSKVTTILAEPGVHTSKLVELTAGTRVLTTVTEAAMVQVTVVPVWAAIC